MKNLKVGNAKTSAAKKNPVKPKSLPLVEELLVEENDHVCGCSCHRPHFGKMVIGLALVLFGLFYLGRNLGILPSINFNFQVVWPILLVLFGFLLINRRSRISIIIGIFSALVMMMILAFVVSFSQLKNEYSEEAVMPVVRHIERSESTSTSIQIPDDLKLNNFKVDEVISSPFSIEGSARGSWFFECSFPVRVLDQSGKELGVGVAQAQSDCLTADFVPFKATVMFTRPTSSAGSLVLQKDNPSGLPENDQKVILPIKF